jgi:PKHD-type hydroxylase
MVLEYYYWFFKSAIPDHICDSIIEAGIESMVEQEKKFGEEISLGSVGGWKQKTKVSDMPSNSKSQQALKRQGVDLDKVYVRDSKVSWLNDRKIYEIIWPFIHEANKNAGWNFDWNFTEDLQFTKYDKGQFYGWHADSQSKPYRQFNPEEDKLHIDEFGNPALDTFGNQMPEDMTATINPNMIGKIRKLSMTLSLSDPKTYKGGNLRFDLGPHRGDNRYHTCKEIRPRGSIVVFPSHVIHQVTPVTSGTRYSLVAWSLGPPFK